MNKDDIIRMAKEAGLYEHMQDNMPGAAQWVGVDNLFQRFAALVAAAERHRLHDKFMQIHQSQQHSNNYWHFAARKIKEEA